MAATVSHTGRKAAPAADYATPPTAIGGRLSQFAPAWERITNTPSVLQAINGLKLQFTQRPPLVPPRRSLETRVATSQVAAVNKEVCKLMKKRAIEPAPHDPGFYSRVFLVPKKTGEKRTVINLKPLNAFIRKKHFRQSTINNVCQTLKPGYWAVCLDLMDAYFHVPIHRHHRRFLRFIWGGCHYQFRCLPFGLSSSPRVFTAVLRPLQHLCRSKGIRIVFYLDDLLILGASEPEVARNRDFVTMWLKVLGFTLNRPKCTFIPAQCFQYLGLQWNIVTLTVCITEDKRQDL